MPSSAFEVRAMPEALEQIAGLDPVVAERVRDKILWLGARAGEIRHLPLRGDLAGLFKRRVGAYRVVYQVLADRRILLIHRVGHRGEIYEPRRG
jgi:mRNA interferase RelE/StbE